MCQCIRPPPTPDNVNREKRCYNIEIEIFTGGKLVMGEGDPRAPPPPSQIKHRKLHTRIL